VVDDAGNPVPGAVVTLSHDVGVVRAAMTDLDGRFELVVAPADAGAASVAATLDQHDPDATSVTLAVDLAPAVRLTLARQFGKLHIESDPSGQVPQVDGAQASDCQSTPCDASVLVGGHDVSFTGADFLPWRQDVAVGKGETASVQARLDRKMGTLTLAGPGPGELTVDGRLVGSSEWSGKLATGQHSVGFRSATTWPFLAQATVSWNQTTQMTLTPTTVAPGDPGAFASNLRSYLNAQGGGTYGVYLEQLSTGSTIGVNDTARLEAASVIKVPEALYLLRQADSGQVNLDDKIDLHPEDFMSGTGSLYTSANPGDTYSYRQLLSLLIQQSDNTAWRALRRVLGDSSINAYAGTLGAGDCIQETNWCSARSAGHLLAQLARGRLLSSGSTRLLLNLLETTNFNDRIPYYLGGTTIAHKVGMDPDNGVANDCGVVFQGSDPFAVCVFTTSFNPDNGAQVIRDIARAAARHY
jgi:beta-lactamase class A